MEIVLIMENINIAEILSILPHRYPFLLVDRVLKIEDEGMVAIKNVTFNEPQFTGHFPDNPIMPGVLIIEALAQVSGLYCYNRLLSKEEIPNRHMFFATINNVKFKIPVVPGDTLRLEVELDRFNGALLKTKCKAYVGDNIACSAELGIWLLEKNKSTDN
jgi:3-hydroxyacyl-[acyl-carrier-protein] dehydratase